MEGSERACPTQDRHGQTEQLSPPDQRSPDRSMRMRSSERDSRAFPLPMHKMDDIPNGDATMYSYTQKQHIFLPGREDTDGCQVLEPRLGSCSGNDTVCDGNRTT